MKLTLKGKLVTIQPPVKSDAEYIYKNITRDVAMNTFIPWPYKLQDAVEFINRSQANRRKQTAFTFAIVPHKVGHVVGIVSLLDIRPKHSRAEIGYLLSRKHRGKGYVNEAVLLALKFAFNKLKFNRVQAHTTPKNISSQNVLENTGFTCEGTLRRYVSHRGRFKDLRIYSILKNEYSVVQ